MKIKQFFIDNKSIIKKVFNIFLIVLFFLVYSYTIFACGYNSKLILEEANKRELVNRKEANNSYNDMNYLVSSSLTEHYPLLVYEYVCPDGDLILNFYCNLSLNDNGINLVYSSEFRFINNSIYTFPSSNLFISFDDLGVDSEFFSTSTISLYFAVSNLFYPVSDDETLHIWSIGFDEIEFIIQYDEFEVAYYFNALTTFDVNDLVNANVWLDTADLWSRYFLNVDDYGEAYSLIEGTFYSGTNPYYFYNSVFDLGYQEGQPKNIFYYNVQNDSPYLLVFDDISYIRPDDYDENLLFKNNYLDLQYLRNLYSGQYSKFRIIFTDSIYSLKDLYLSLDNSSLNDYNILVNGKAYSINSSGTLNIPSSELLQVIEFDNLLLDSTRLVNSSPDFANGFNSGYENGYQNGYDEGVIEEESYYEELVIPAVKIEYEQIGFDKGYEKGKNDTLNEGSGVALFDAFTLIGKGFEAWNPILNIQVLPGLTIGVFIAIPIVIAVVIIVIKLLQR